MTRLVSAALFAVAVVSTAGQQPSAPSQVADVQTIGPQVGARVPSFILTDQSGRARSLESLMGPKGAILVFFRSADW
jgi:cytochrome oxidase Cu insertion factor (SCO1/SenC/PrrC family)